MTITDYSIKLIPTFKDAWSHVGGFKIGRGYKFMLWSGVFALFIAALFLSIFLGAFFSAVGFDAPLKKEVLQICSIVFLAPMVVGISMMAIRMVRQEALAFSQSFMFYRNFFKIAGVAILVQLISHYIPALIIAVLMALGQGHSSVVGALFFSLILLIFLFVIYASFAYSFALLVLVDKKVGVWQAMELSRKTVQRHWFKLFGICTLALLILGLCFSPALLAFVVNSPLLRALFSLFSFTLIWTLPWFLGVLGVVYRDAFSPSLRGTK